MKTFVMTKDSKTLHLPKTNKVVNWKDFAKSAIETREQSQWVMDGSELLKKFFNSLDENFFKQQAEIRKRVRIILLAEASLEIQRILEALFKEAIILSEKTSLPLNELLYVLNGKNPEFYVIGGQIDEMTQTVTLIRGNLESIVVPFSVFHPSGNEIKPDYSKFSIEDYGQTLKFGEYEASVDSILYEFDPIYRREKRKELIKKDRSFGACLRRLRLQKGIRQTDFKDIGEKELGRIEKGEVKPRKTTLEKISKILGVSLEEIKSY